MARSMAWRKRPSDLVHLEGGPGPPTRPLSRRCRGVLERAGEGAPSAHSGGRRFDLSARRFRRSLFHAGPISKGSIQEL